MLKLITLLISSLTIVFFLSFDIVNQNLVNNITQLKLLHDTTNCKKVYGAWVHHDSVSFTLIEIKDTSNVDVTYYFDLKKRIDTLTKDRFTFIKAKGKWTFWSDSTINVEFPKFWFDFKIKDDTLFEIGKEGDDAKYFKMNQKLDSSNSDKFGQFPIH